MAAEAAARCIWARKSAKPFSAAAAMLFSKKFTAKALHCRSNLKTGLRCQVLGLQETLDLDLSLRPKT